MSLEFLLLGLVGLFLIFGPIVIAIMANNKVSRLVERVLNLEDEARVSRRYINELTNHIKRLSTGSLAAGSIVAEGPDIPDAPVGTSVATSSADPVRASAPLEPEATEPETDKKQTTSGEAVSEASDSPEQPEIKDPVIEQPEAVDPVGIAAERSLEENIGTRWAVWVGGLALALGGVFLIRYSIEAGFLVLPFA